MNDIILKVRNLKKEFPINAGIIFQRKIGAVRAVDDVNFDLFEGETLGIVGESGCGKSTLGRTILRLIEPTSGYVEFLGKDVFSLNSKNLRSLRPYMQIVFQDPQSSLDPRMCVGEIVAEPLKIHKRGTKREITQRVSELFELVGLPHSIYNRYPHEFSGGQQQRIGIARAIALDPKMIIADEPVSSLDVSIQAGILNLLRNLQKHKNLSYIFISHDLAVVKHISNRIIVMYMGRIVEMAAAKEIYRNPLHPYTKVLLSAHLDPFKKRADKLHIKGELQDSSKISPGCNFYARCSDAVGEICRSKIPALQEVTNNHFAACFGVDK